MRLVRLVGHVQQQLKQVVPADKEARVYLPSIPLHTAHALTRYLPIQSFELVEHRLLMLAEMPSCNNRRRRLSVLQSQQCCANAESVVTSIIVPRPFDLKLESSSTRNPTDACEHAHVPNLVSISLTCRDPSPQMDLLLSAGGGKEEGKTTNSSRRVYE